MKRITRASIMGELVDKFSLQEFEREDFLFGEFVVPIYDIGAHVKNWSTEESRVSITDSTSFAFFEVPVNEKWRIRRLDVIHETGANFDICQIYLYGSATKHQYIFYDTTNPITSGTVKIFEFSQDIIMEPGELTKLYILTDNFVAGGNVSLHLLKEVEIVR